jgi:hypothetical protein
MFLSVCCRFLRFATLTANLLIPLINLLFFSLKQHILLYKPDEASGFIFAKYCEKITNHQMEI